MSTEVSQSAKETKAKLDYLKDLLTDRTMLAADPVTYLHVGKLLEKEILRIRSSLFSTYGIYTIADSDLPEPEGPKVSLQKKVYMPADANSSFIMGSFVFQFNFVGRILGPDGSTAKCLQQCLGVKIMVRGKGSIRDRKKEEANLGKPNWEHLNDNLHVVLSVEDHENRAKARLNKASEYIALFLKESMKGSDKDDKVKQMQLMELSFRRESRPWHFNCNSLFDLSLPQKPGVMFSNVANLLNFGYTYPPAPLLSPLHHNGHPPPSHPSHHHLYHNSTQHLQQHQHFSRQSQTHALSGHGSNQNGGPITAGLSPPFSSNLNAAAAAAAAATAVLVGHAPSAATGYPGSYSPSSHPQIGPSSCNTVLPAGLAMAATPLGYWSGHGLSHFPPEYALNHSQLTAVSNTHHTTANGFGTHEDNLCASISLPNHTSSAQPGGGNNSHAMFLPQHPQALTCGIHEDRVPQFVLTDMGTCNLDTATDLDSRISAAGSASLNGLCYTSSLSVQNHVNKSANSSSAATNNTGGTGSANKHHGVKQRYSQKHSCQLIQHSNQSENGMHHPLPLSVSATTPGSRGSSRSAVVSVKLNSNNDRHLSSSSSSALKANANLVNSAETNGYGTSKNTGKFRTSKEEVKSGSGIAVTRLGATQQSVRSTPQVSISSCGSITESTSVESDWPKLGATVQ
ncbi:hypothetical protein PHET_06217 [Paragonimus heterotremus]|uniref:K Homology domain-containing protein n=1 Tax=Paragonimus heterotremus TaxID=100268 RepID=A0A8J4T7A1_9TREM|nr:hypothetical protein PHET_06217 [Paragonimus heterotremus]